MMSVVTSGRPPTHKNLFGWIGRIWQGLWLACGIAIFVFITSTVTSVMTTLQLSNQISGIADLAGKPVAVRAGSTADDHAVSVGLSVRHHDNLEQAVQPCRKVKSAPLSAMRPFCNITPVLTPAAVRVSWGNC